MYEDGGYLAHNPTWHTENSAWKAQQVAKILVKNELSPSTIHEVGCGAGEVLLSLLQLLPAARGTGFDVSPQAIALCRSKMTDRATFELGDLLQMNTRAELLLVIDVIEHVEDYIGFSRRLADHADHVVFHIPLDLSAQALLRGYTFSKARKEIGHLHYFTKDTALDTVRDAGYDVIDWSYTYTQSESPGRSLRVRLADIPRRLTRLFAEDLAIRALGGCSVVVLCRKSAPPPR
jgi:cyclopropane fatty-acyl-phospholipid synthase-like methyltransferase